MDETDNDNNDKYKLANLFASIFPLFKKERIVDVTAHLASIFSNRCQGVTLASPDDCFHYDLITKDVPIDLLRIEPRQYTDLERGRQRYAVIDFTNPVLWNLIVSRYRRIVIGRASSSKYGERDVYYPIFREMAFSQTITLARLELYGMAFTQEMLKHVASFPFKELVLEGITHEDEVRLVVNPSLNALCPSIIGKTPLRLCFPPAVKILETLGLGGAKQYRNHGAITGMPVDMSLGDLYVVEGSPSVIIKNLLFLVNGLDIVTNSIDAFLGKFVTVDRVFVCLDSCGVYYPLYPNLTITCDDFHPQSTISHDSNTHGGLSSILTTMDNHKVRHLGFDAGFTKEFLVGVDINTLLPFFCTMEFENITVNGVKKYPLVFSDSSDVSVWTWDSVTRDASKKTYPTKHLPSLSKVNNFSFTISADTVFRKNFYMVVNRKDSDVTMPSEVSQITLEAQSSNLIRPPQGVLSSIKKRLFG